MKVSYTPLRIPVDGGSIAAGRWGEGDRIVVASHGITANHQTWLRVAQLVAEHSHGEVSLVAVDHRGRAGSADTPGPFGLKAHGDDLIAVLDHLDLATAALAGHSLGGFIVTAAAEKHPHRIERLVMVDGGLPFLREIPPDADVEAMVQAVIGPALDRLDQQWPDVDAYLDFFRAHPAFQPPNEWTAAVEEYVRYDAVTTPDGNIRSSVDKEAVLVDGGAVIVDPESASAIERSSAPAVMLWAPRGLFDESPGLYTQQYVADSVSRLTHLRAQLVDDTNHYTIVTSDHGAGAVADAIIG